MKNKKVHFNTPNHAHELTFSCFRGKNILLNNQFCVFLVDAINKARDKHILKIWAYVFMPNHVHLLIYPMKDSYSISGILLTIKQSSARRSFIHIRKYNQNPLRHFETGIESKKYRFWQDGGGYDRNITKKQSLVKTINYIHNNPVRKGLVDSPDKWKWSSFNDWYGDNDSPLLIDKEEIPLF